MSSDETNSMVYLLSGIYLCIIGVLGVFANVLIVLVFWKYRRLRTATNLFLLNLGLCDLAVALLDVIFSIVSTWQQRWMFSEAACVTYGFLHYFFACVTVSTLAGISIDRFYVITKPADGSWITKPRAGVMILIIYLYTLLFTFPPLLGWSEFTLEKVYYSGCYINYDDGKLATSLYAIVVTLFFFMVPFIIMLYCYYHIFMTVRRSTMRKLASVIIPRHKSLRRPLSTQAHVKTARMISIVLVFFVIVWAPYFVNALLRSMWDPTRVPHLFTHIAILLTKTCVVYNAVIYAVVNHRFRTAFLNTLCCCRKTRPSSSHLPGKESMIYSRGHSRVDSFHNSPKTISHKQRERRMSARSAGEPAKVPEDRARNEGDRRKPEHTEHVDYILSDDPKMITLTGEENCNDLMNQTQLTEIQFESSLDENSFASKRKRTQAGSRSFSPVQNGEVVLDFDTLGMDPKSTSTPYHKQVSSHSKQNGYITQRETPLRTKPDQHPENTPRKKTHRISRSPILSVTSNTTDLDGDNNVVTKKEGRLSPSGLDAAKLMSPRELMDVQNYWKRMSLLLDDISIDDITI